jgi:hypothetical protein
MVEQPEKLTETVSPMAAKNCRREPITLTGIVDWLEISVWFARFFVWLKTVGEIDYRFGAGGVSMRLLTYFRSMSGLSYNPDMDSYPGRRSAALVPILSHSFSNPYALVSGLSNNGDTDSSR